MHLPLGAPVQAADGTEPVGRVSRLVVHFQDHSVTHLVVRRGLLLPHDVLVAVGDVARLEDGTVHLSLSEAALKALPEFSAQQFRTPGEGWVPPAPYIGGIGDFLLWAENADNDVRAALRDMEDPENILLSSGTAVYCEDSVIGTVDEIFTDPATGEITEFIVRQGMLLHKDVRVPMSLVDAIDASGVRLRISADEARQLPALSSGERDESA